MHAAAKHTTANVCTKICRRLLTCAGVCTQLLTTPLSEVIQKDGSLDSFAELLKDIANPTSLAEFDPEMFKASLEGEALVLAVGSRKGAALRVDVCTHNLFPHAANQKRSFASQWNAICEGWV